MDNQNGSQYPTNRPYTGETENYEAASPAPAFSGAFDDDSLYPAIDTSGQPVAPQYNPPMYDQYGQPAPQTYVPTTFGQPAQQQYVPPMYDQFGQPVPQTYVPPMYGQPVQQTYVPPMYGQPVPQQYVPPMYDQSGQPVPQTYVPPMYGQPVPQYYVPVQPVQQVQVMPKEVMERKVFRKHCSRVGLMLMADQGLMLVVIIAVVLVAAIVFGLLSELSGKTDSSGLMWEMMGPIMLASGLSAIAGNLLPASLHLRKWKYKFADPFRGDKLNAGFILAALLTALGLNTAWCWVYYYVKDWFENFVQIHPGGDEALYTPETMPLLGMIFYLIWVCIIAPVTEEYIVRGAMLRTLSKYGAGFGIVASAFAFGLMHGNMGQTPMAFLIGLVMGYVAAKSGNIRQTIFIHFVNNVLASLPQIINYFVPGLYDSYSYYVQFFDYFTMLFAAAALLYFVVKRAAGLSARRKREAAGSEEISGAERAWLRLEIPDGRRLPVFYSVKHKFLHFVTSGGMIFFNVVCLLSIFVNSFLPYLLGHSIDDMGF